MTIAAYLRSASRRVLVALGSVCLAFGAAAQKYPDHQIELVVPFAPGGSTDAMARLVAPKLSRQLGVPVVVVNKPGAGGTIGTAYVLAAPDGYRIMTGGNSNLGPVLALGESVGYRLGDVAGLGLGTTNPLAIVARPERFADFGGFVSEVGSKPAGALTAASWGLKTPSHFYIALLGQQLKGEFLHVPFDGGAKAMLAAMAGQVDFAIVTVATALTNIQAGKLKALAVTSGARSLDLPSVPTVNELGYPGGEYVSFDGFATSAKLPAERLELLRASFSVLLDDPQYKEGIRKMGAEPAFLPGAAYDDFLRKNLQTLSEVASRTPIKD